MVVFYKGLCLRQGLSFVRVISNNDVVGGGALLGIRKTELLVSTVFQISIVKLTLEYYLFKHVFVSFGSESERVDWIQILQNIQILINQNLFGLYSFWIRITNRGGGGEWRIIPFASLSTYGYINKCAHILPLHIHTNTHCAAPMKDRKHTNQVRVFILQHVLHVFASFNKCCTAHLYEFYCSTSAEQYAFVCNRIFPHVLRIE